MDKMMLWSKIASKLPGRSDNEIKNYWHTHLKKRANYNSMCETTEQDDMNCNYMSETPEQHDMNVSSICEANVVENIHDNHSNNRFGSLLLPTCEDDNTSSSSSTTSNDHEVEFRDDYYDLCSPGTVKDVQCFWTQFCGLENLERTSHENISIDHVFPYSYDEATSPYNFHNNDFDTIKDLI
ncbi:hypothetical protein L1987_58572 [Smallanthus sonchifolius]|uniref:Uncharacterized protein n=1 Tax=Smallanthus sonchifolius TaxID=185202 RepID=A0ACB9DG51_9ASTR|nr:hypothetical protein L1987_58572 [Smallanthus sonchifolius]